MSKVNRFISRYGIVTILLIMIVAQLANAQPSQRAYQIKAAFLYNFAKFIEWPDAAFPTAESPFNLCVLGIDSFGMALQQLQGKTIRSHKISLQYIKDDKDLLNCHLLFIGVHEQSRLSKIFTLIGTAPVLTVSETKHIFQFGGAIYLFTENNKMRFSINLEAIQHANLHASSKLLHLAKAVKSMR